jgi:CubicO group peptidase (beta-lactamase class C family)
VERGQLTVDDPVYQHISELVDFKIVRKFDDQGKAVKAQHTKPITSRTFLTHTSGLTYDAIHPKSLSRLGYRNRAANVDVTLLQRFDALLTFEPGESWMYGPGIDYAGLLIERISGLTLEGCMHKNLWERLGIKGMTLQIESRPGMKARIADMSLRDDESGKVEYTNAGLTYADEDLEGVQYHMGGQGAFTSPEEYLKILHALLTTDEDEKILRKASLAEFFTPQFGEGASEAINEFLQNDEVYPRDDQ